MKHRDWTSGPLPVTSIEARAVLAEITETVNDKPTPRTSAKFVQELVACFPNIKLTTEDSRIFMGKLSLIFEAYSTDSARKTLDPVKGFVGKAQFLNLADLNAELHQHENKILWVQMITKQIIAEHDRRDAEAADHEKWKAEDAAFKEANGGKSRVQILTEAQPPSQALRGLN